MCTPAAVAVAAVVDGAGEELLDSDDRADPTDDTDVADPILNERIFPTNSSPNG